MLQKRDGTPVAGPGPTVLRRSAGAAPRIADARTAVLRAQVDLLGELGALVADRARLDGAHDELGAGLVRHLRDGVQDLIAFSEAVGREALQGLEADGMSNVGSAGISSIPYVGTVIDQGLGAYRTYQTNATIEEGVDLSQLRERHAARATDELAELIIDNVFTEGSLIHQLRQFESRGQRLQREIGHERRELTVLLEDLNAGVVPSQRQLSHRVTRVEELRDALGAWQGEYETTRQRARETVAGIPQRMRDAVGQVIVAHDEAGGELPRGVWRFRLARQRLRDAVVGETGKVVLHRHSTPGSSSRHSSWRIEIGGRRYALWAGHRSVVRRGQEAVVVDVLPDEPKTDPEMRERWRPSDFELKVELGAFETTVPPVRGLPAQEAIARVFESGLLPEFEEEVADTTGRFAVGTRPPSGTTVASRHNDFTPVTVLLRPPRGR